MSSSIRYQLPDGFRRKDESRFVKRLFPHRKNFFNFVIFQSSPIITIFFQDFMYFEDKQNSRNQN